MVSGPVHFVLVAGDGGDLATEPRLAQAFERRDVGTVTRHGQNRDAHRPGTPQTIPEVQVGGVTFDHPQPLGREPLDSGSVVVDANNPEPVVIGQSLVGGEPDPAHSDHDNFGATGVPRALLGVQAVFVLCG